MTTYLSSPSHHSRINIQTNGKVAIKFNLRTLGIEKCLGKAKEGIGSKGFIKRAKTEEATRKVASKVTSGAAYTTLEQSRF
ncbi:hypothetical protein PIB30_063377 [Stylosanthes scabra]|uniref:Uncharacterized protein n=1 Tax=Stylosanthes scabra TaxID=79078 RepID=A0ABU6VMD6_9FABA|nr:hypothetical protein [Stylosanthes scabra]